MKGLMCPLCLGTGVVAIYAAVTVKAVREGRGFRCAHRSAVACDCLAGQSRFHALVTEDGEVNRFVEGEHCPLPSLRHVPKTWTAAYDASVIARWVNHTAPVGGEA